MSIVRVCDIESTGLPEDPVHAICELGWIDLDLDGLKIGNPKTFFVNPGHPIPPHIRAIHHISDRDVAAAMPPDQAVAYMLKDLKSGDVLSAHRADFEKSFIDAGDRPWVCTLKAALLAWPALKSHSNQALRYELDLDADPDFVPEAAMPPHRALPDAIVTAHILRRLLALRPLSRLIEIERSHGFLPRMPIGKHFGMPFKDVPRSYLDWIVNKSGMDPKKDADLIGTATYWLGKSTAKEPTA
jgi:exodeoxyribonuclease X